VEYKRIMFLKIKINVCDVICFSKLKKPAPYGKTTINIWAKNNQTEFFQFFIAKTQYRKFEINIPKKGIARPKSHNFHIHVSLSDLYIPTIVLPILSILVLEYIWADPGNIKSLTDTLMRKLGLKPRNFFSGNI
jgi:hypothetical protein